MFSEKHFDVSLSLAECLRVYEAKISIAKRTYSYICILYISYVI